MIFANILEGSRALQTIESEMRADFSIILQNAADDISYLRDCRDQLLAETETRKLYRSWAGLLQFYTSAAGALIRATDMGGSKRWSDDLKHQQKSDPILNFALQARNAHHVHERRRPTVLPSVEIGGGAIAISGNIKSFRLTNSSVSGDDGRLIDLPEISGEILDGKFVGPVPPGVIHRNGYISVTEVYNRGIRYGIPNTEIPEDRRAIEIANYLCSWLEKKLEEALALASEGES